MGTAIGALAREEGTDATAAAFVLSLPVPAAGALPATSSAGSTEREHACKTILWSAAVSMQENDQPCGKRQLRFAYEPNACARPAGAGWSAVRCVCSESAKKQWSHLEMVGNSNRDSEFPTEKFTDALQTESRWTRSWSSSTQQRREV